MDEQLTKSKQAGALKELYSVTTAFTVNNLDSSTKPYNFVQDKMSTDLT